MPMLIERTGKPRRCPTPKRIDGQRPSIELKADSDNFKELYREIRLQSVVNGSQPNFQRRVRTEIDCFAKSIERSASTVVIFELIPTIESVDALPGRFSISVRCDKIHVSSASSPSEQEVLFSRPIPEGQAEFLWHKISTWMDSASNQSSLAIRATKLEASTGVEDALDLIYFETDELMRTAQFEAIDEVLSLIDPKQLSTNLLLGFLTATLPVRSKLPSRAILLEESKNALIERGEFEADLFTGL